MSGIQKDKLANEWLIAITEVFAQKRMEYAPIDEPCDKWLEDIIFHIENM